MLFLDEPTSGLDPSNARQMKDLILQQKAMGRTIILTTHNMQDATELCDKVAFIVDGTIRAMDTPHNLIMQKGAKKLIYTYLEDEEERSSRCLLDKTGDNQHFKDIIDQNRLLTIHSMEPNLGDIFMEVTGRKLS